MPLPTQPSLLSILLVWTTIISIIQAVFIILFFTQGHKDLLQNSSITESTSLKNSRIDTTPLPASMDRLHSCRGKMLSFKAVGGKDAIKWFPKNPNEDLISATNPTTNLIIRHGGYYFLTLQVTLDKCANTQMKRTVHLRRSNEVILEGWFNADTNSTGLLSKVELLPTGEELRVTVRPPCSLNFNESVTHLDIIYLPLER